MAEFDSKISAKIDRVYDAHKKKGKEAALKILNKEFADYDVNVTYIWSKYADTGKEYADYYISLMGNKQSYNNDSGYVYVGDVYWDK